MLLVDVLPSGDFGSGTRSKMEAAAQLAAQVAFSAVANGNRVGLILFSDRVERLVPPRKGRKHALAIIADILDPFAGGARHQSRRRAHGVAVGAAAALGRVPHLRLSGARVREEAHRRGAQARPRARRHHRPGGGGAARHRAVRARQSRERRRDHHRHRRSGGAAALLARAARRRRTAGAAVPPPAPRLARAVVDDNHGDALARLFRRRDRWGRA